MAGTPKTHHPGDSPGTTSCGVSSAGLPLSDDIAAVTCGRCIRKITGSWPSDKRKAAPAKPKPEPVVAVEEPHVVTLRPTATNHDRKVWEPEPTRALYDHDCDVCQFLGHFEDFDMYFCPQNGHSTVIVRDGNNPQDYRSGLAFATQDTGLALAYARAHQQGLI